MAEGRDPNADRLGRLENGLAALHDYLNAINLQMDFRHFCDLFHPISRME